ncbi:MAG: TusE/DsrC/DsvC family sulfur relay protein [Chromatiales bacterium]|jgi:tRNA 2-thiouridine synthesizing protein E
MTLEVNGKEIETTDSGFLVDQDAWDEGVAEAIANEEGVELTEKHWDVIKFLRDEYFNNNGNQPNTRNMVKGMQGVWEGENVTSKMLYDLFPKDPSKQAGRIGGLPESRRKGGY